MKFYRKKKGNSAKKRIGMFEGIHQQYGGEIQKDDGKEN